jgi:hypothetical protein
VGWVGLGWVGLGWVGLGWIFAREEEDVSIVTDAESTTTYESAERGEESEYNSRTISRTINFE